MRLWGVVTAAACVLLAGCSEYDGRLELVRAKLKDPASAQFTNVRDEKGILCGFVNAKNELGGYTGPRAFIVSGTVVVIDDPQANAIERARTTGALIGACG